MDEGFSARTKSSENGSVIMGECYYDSRRYRLLAVRKERRENAAASKFRRKPETEVHM